MAGAVDDHGLMIAESLLPAAQFAVPESEPGVAQMISVGNAAISASPASMPARKSRLAVISRGKTAEASRLILLARTGVV